MSDTRLDRLFKNKSYEILEMFPVMWLGWECDSEAFLISVEGEGIQLVTTSHGSPQLHTKEDALVWLDDKIKEYDKIGETTKNIREKMK